MAQTLRTAVDHSCQGQVGADAWRPPGLKGNSGVEPQLICPALELDRWGRAQLLLGLAAAVAIEAIDRPIAVWSQIHFPVALLSRGCQKRLEAGGGPGSSCRWPCCAPSFRPVGLQGAGLWSLGPEPKLRSAIPLASNQLGAVGPRGMARSKESGGMPDAASPEPHLDHRPCCCFSRAPSCSRALNCCSGGESELHRAVAIMPGRSQRKYTSLADDPSRTAPPVQGDQADAVGR